MRWFCTKKSICILELEFLEYVVKPEKKANKPLTKTHMRSFLLQQVRNVSFCMVQVMGTSTGIYNRNSLLWYMFLVSILKLLIANEYNFKDTFTISCNLLMESPGIEFLFPNLLQNKAINIILEKVSLEIILIGINFSIS